MENTNDGNVVFKCTYHDRNYRGLCSTVCRNSNIEIGKTWCSNEMNDCFKALKKGKLYPNNHYPCNESKLFYDWEYGCGTYHRGKRKGEPIPARNIKANKLAILTTRIHRDDESRRKIFGFLHIKKFYPENKTTGNEAYVEADKKYSLEIDDTNLYPFFWDYYENPNKPTRIAWSTGLFRYLSDEQVYLILLAIKDRYKQISGAEEKKAVIDYQVNRYLKYVDKRLLKKVEKKVVRKECVSEKGLLSKLLRLHEKASPEKREGIFSAFERQAPGISMALKRYHNYKCQICGWHGFEKKSGGKYIEIHHLIPLSKKGTNRLDNLIVVCPNHHKLLDFSENTLQELCNGKIKISVKNNEYIVNKNIIDSIIR